MIIAPKSPQCDWDIPGGMESGNTVYFLYAMSDDELCLLLGVVIVAHGGYCNQWGLYSRESGAREGCYLHVRRTDGMRAYWLGGSVRVPLVLLFLSRI